MSQILKHDIDKLKHTSNSLTLNSIVQLIDTVSQSDCRIVLFTETLVPVLVLFLLTITNRRNWLNFITEDIEDYHRLSALQ